MLKFLDGELKMVKNIGFAQIHGMKNGEIKDSSK